MSVDQQELVRLKLEKLKKLEAEKKLRDNLPHLYGQKFYRWSREWFENTDKFALMFKGNQVGGSSVQIRKAIHWATDPELREKLFKKKPYEKILFLYFMPSLNLFAREFHNKWIPQFMPRNESRVSGLYAWNAVYDEKRLNDISFIDFPEANAQIVCLSYGSDPHKAMQAQSPDAVFADEEMPEHLFAEVIARLSATKGYFNMTCTPTRGEKIWEEAYNGRRFPHAYRLIVSQYDCVEFEDGTPGVHGVDDIKKFELTLPTQRDVDIRVNGKFSKLQGLVYSQFERGKNNVKLSIRNPIYYAGVDYGSGGLTGHPSAIAIIAVDESFQRARLHKFWRGDGDRTTAGDLFSKYLELTDDIVVARRKYDFAAADFGTIAMRSGVPFEKANKNHEQGISMINTLFKNQMLEIPVNDENEKLMQELESFKIGDKAHKAENDGCDALRYALVDIPFYFSGLTGEVLESVDEPKEEEPVKRTKSRFELANPGFKQDEQDDYIHFYNDLYEG